MFSNGHGSALNQLVLFLLSSVKVSCILSYKLWCADPVSYTIWGLVGPQLGGISFIARIVFLTWVNWTPQKISGANSLILHPHCGQTNKYSPQSDFASISRFDDLECMKWMHLTLKNLVNCMRVGRQVILHINSRVIKYHLCPKQDDWGGEFSLYLKAETLLLDAKALVMLHFDLFYSCWKFRIFFDSEVYMHADIDNEFVTVNGMPDEIITVAGYVEQNYGIRHDFIGWVVLILFAYIIVFLGVSAVALKKLNFQQK